MLALIVQNQLSTASSAPNVKETVQKANRVRYKVRALTGIERTKGPCLLVVRCDVDYPSSPPMLRQRVRALFRRRQRTEGGPQRGVALLYPIEV